MAQIIKRLAFGATIRGRSHLKDDKPNQDAFCIASDDELGVYAAVVSDGAGSASHSHVGSRGCADYLANEFLNIGRDLVNGKLQASWVEHKILHAIGEHIQALESDGRSLRDFHHTLSAVIATSTGGRLIQIGDSPALVTEHERPLTGVVGADLPHVFRQHSVHDEAKGEYANETHFVTQPEWRKHIRITPLPRGFGAIFLMSDGAGAAFISRGKVYEPSMFAALSEIIGSPASGKAAFEKYLSHPELDEITADDKTIVAVIPAAWFGTPGEQSGTSIQSLLSESATSLAVEASAVVQSVSVAAVPGEAIPTGEAPSLGSNRRPVVTAPSRDREESGYRIENLRPQNTKTQASLRQAKPNSESAAGIKPSTVSKLEASTQLPNNIEVRRRPLDLRAIMVGAFASLCLLVSGGAAVLVYQKIAGGSSNNDPSQYADAAEQKAAEQKAAEQKATEQKAAEQKAAEQKAAEQKAVESKAAEQKAVEQKAAEQKAAESKAAERKAVEQKAAERKAAEQKAAERKAAERKAVEQKAVERKAVERKAVERKAVEQKAVEQKAVEQKAAEQKAAEQKAAEQKAAEQKAAEQKAAEQKAAAQ